MIKKCCICGDVFEGWGNNPFPLCGREDGESKCCDTCNTLVVMARMAQMGKETEVNVTPKNSTLAILWSKNSNMPIETLRDKGKILGGQVTDVDYEKNTAKGEWGNFEVDLKEDNWFLVI